MNHCITIEIGGIPVAFTAPDPEIIDGARMRYAAFLSSAAEPELTIQVETTEPGRTCETLEVLCRNRVWSITHLGFEAQLDLNTRSGFIRQRPNSVGVECVLRIALMLLLAPRGGFLLHAASAVIDRRGFVLSGMSGAGKTTLARLAPPRASILTDEISLIQPGNGGYIAWGTPFYGELGRSGDNISAPVANAFFLKQGPSNLLSDLGPSEACRLLMRNILFFAQDDHLVQCLFASACSFITKVPVAQLTFRPEPAAWDLIA